MSTIWGARIICFAAFLLPISLSAQVNAPGQQRRVGRMQRDNCATDSTRSFRRGVGDTTRATPGGSAPTSTITGGTQRSHEYPEYDVVLDVPNL